MYDAIVGLGPGVFSAVRGATFVFDVFLVVEVLLLLLEADELDLAAGFSSLPQPTSPTLRATAAIATPAIADLFFMYVSCRWIASNDTSMANTGKPERSVAVPGWNPIGTASPRAVRQNFRTRSAIAYRSLVAD
jgi:hypothetical protein